MNTSEKIARERFGKAIADARNQNGWSQKQLASKISRGLPEGEKDFEQKKISNLERNASNVRLTEAGIRAIQAVCRLSDDIVAPLLEEITNTPAQAQTPSCPVHIQEKGQLSCKASDPDSALGGYCGEYSCLFVSTDSTNPVLVEGKLRIDVDPKGSGQCLAHMAIYNDQKEEIKWYSGPFFLNQHYRTWHCILVGEKKQEICMLTASHFNATIRPNQYNMALSLTTSSGVQKRPTVHRLLISREPIPQKAHKLIRAHLRLNTDSICIEENALEELEKDTLQHLETAVEEKDIAKYQAVLRCIARIRGAKRRVYYTIDESIIYDSQEISVEKEVRSFVVSEIRSYTPNMYYNKVSQTVLDICADIIEKRI